MLKDIRSDNVLRVRNINADLEKLLDKGSRTDSGTNTKRQAAKAVKLYHRVRKQACGLFSIFKDKLEPPACSCAESHSVGLRMDLRDVDKTISGFNEDDSSPWNHEKDPLKFRTFITLTAFEFNNEWREADVELEEDISEDEQSRSESVASIRNGTASPAFHRSSKSFSGILPARDEITRDKSALQIPSTDGAR